MSYGMSYDEFWYGEPYRAKFYREARILKAKQKDEESWLQGVYIYDALCRVSPILHAFCKSGTKPLPYVEKPYMAKQEEDKVNEQKRIENERLIAQVHFQQWARAAEKRFNNKEV